MKSTAVDESLSSMNQQFCSRENQFLQIDKNLDLITTYLGRIDMTRVSKIQAEERFHILEQGYTLGKLLDGM